MEREAFAASSNAYEASHASREELAAREEALEESGMEGVRRWELDRLLTRESPDPIRVARLYAHLGDKDKAFEWLEEAWSKPLYGMQHAPTCHFWDSLRKDPRFEELLRKQKLPEDAIARHMTMK
jgi:hypothetical protein